MPAVSLSSTLNVRKLPFDAQQRDEAGHPRAMLTEIYNETLLVSEELTNQVWEDWDKGLINDWVAAVLWLHFENWHAWQEGQS